MKKRDALVLHWHQCPNTRRTFLCEARVDNNAAETFRLGSRSALQVAKEIERQCTGYRKLRDALYSRKAELIKDFTAAELRRMPEYRLVCDILKEAP